MKLIEKKCPNCGAALEFEESDKSCKCQYCKRSFEIERDTDNLEKFNLIYDKIQKPMQTMFLIPFFIIVGIIILFIAIRVFSAINNPVVESSTDIDIPNIDIPFLEEETEEKLLMNVSELSNSDFDSIDNHSTPEISHTGQGVNNADHSYSIDGKITREKLYIAYKEGQNYVIPIYKATYRDFFHQNDRHTVYIPIVFENIEKNVLFSLGNAKLSAPEYYFNEDHSSFTYGYGSLEEAYNNVIKPYEEEYQISEK